MPAQCSPELFKEFENEAGGTSRPGEKGQQYLYEILGDHLEFSNVTPLSIPFLDNKTFANWQKFEYWCDDIKNNLMWKIIDENDLFFQEAFENLSPKKYFKNKKVVKEKIIEVLCDKNSEDIETITYVEINCKNKKLFLIYFGADGWALGHSDSVLVLKSLSHLNKKNGFYPIK